MTASILPRSFAVDTALAVALSLCASAAIAATFSAASFGAKADGSTMNTVAIQAAIDAAAKKGGTVTFEPGTYLTGAIFVKSGVTLQLDKGVTLKGSQNIADYPVMPSRIAGIEMSWPSALVNIYKQKNAAIVGQGTIDGDGKVFWDSYWTLRKAYEPRGLRWASDYDAGRPRLVQVFESSKVNVGGGLLMRRSGFWTLHICYSDNVTVDNVKIRNNDDGHGPSTDGIDVDSSRKVLIQHADISVNDDALVMKSGRDSDGLRVARPTEDVVVRDSIVRAGAAGITIGSETSGGFRNIDAYNVLVLGAVPNGVLFKSAHTRGGFAENINIHDFTMLDVAVPVKITMNWNPSYSYATIPSNVTTYPPYWKVLATPVPKEQGMARFHDVRIAGIKATNAKTAFEVDGFAVAPLERFKLDKLNIEARAGGHINDARNWSVTNSVLKLGAGGPVALQDDAGVKGLPEGSYVIKGAIKTAAQ
ncbi:MAG: glycosyl hydrolase family 28 protein [Massilia sp.]